MNIEQNEIKILKELAKKQVALSSTEENKHKIRKMYGLHDDTGYEPVVTIEIDTFEGELIPKRLKCTTETARAIEAQLYRNILHAEVCGDDLPVKNYFGLRYKSFFVPFNIPIQVDRSDGLGHHFDPQINDLEEDFDKLQKSVFGLDKESSRKQQELYQEILGDSIEVKFEGASLYCCLTQSIVHLMGMENMFINMMDNEELFLKMMDMLATDYIDYFNMMLSQGAMLPTKSFEWLGQGSMCFNNTLPNTVKTMGDVWGFMDSQESVGVNPEMYERLIFPAYRKVFENFGLFSYGCCEPVHEIWDNCLSTVKNLKKTSISPWCNEEFMGERLRNSGIVYHRKPSPNFLGINPILDEEATRAHIQKTVKAAKGCRLEFASRDVYTIHDDENKLKRYIEIIKEESTKHQY